MKTNEPEVNLEDIKVTGKWTGTTKQSNHPPEFKAYYMNQPYVPPESAQNACRALYLYESLPDYLKKHEKISLIARENDTTIQEMNKHWRCIDRNQKCWKDEE